MEHVTVSTRKPPSLLLCIAVPLFILVIGVVVAGMFAVKALPELAAESKRGVVPPGFTTGTLEPGGYTVWIYSFAMHDGKGYEAAEGLPSGAQLVLRSEPDGRGIDLVSFLNSTKSFNDEKAVAAGQFDLMTPTEISLIGSGFPRDTVVSIAPQKMGSAFRVFLTLGGILVGTFLAAIITLFVLLHRRRAVIESM